MIADDKYDYVVYRLKNASETHKAAKVLADNELWNSAINRLYYASFYAVTALLISSGIHVKSHTAAKRQFNIHYIRTQKLPISHGQLFAQLLGWRQKSNYEYIHFYTSEMILPLIPQVKEMLLNIELLIETERL